MKKLSITLITLVIFSAAEGLAQEKPAHHTNTIDQSSAATESFNYHSDSTSLAAIAKLPLNKIHFENKGVRQAVNARWEDSILEKDSLIKTMNTPEVNTVQLASNPEPMPSKGFKEMVEDQKNSLHSGPSVKKMFLDDLKNQPSSTIGYND